MLEPADGPVLDRASAIFGAFAHPIRIRILQLLFDQELNVGNIATELGIGQTSASQHLAVLLRAGILVVVQKGTSRYYKVRGPRVKQIVDTLLEFCQIHGLSGVPDEESL